MPTPAELALQKKYAALRAKKEKAAGAEAAAPAKASDGHVKLKISLSKQSKSVEVDERKPGDQNAVTSAQPQAPKVILRSKNAGRDRTAPSRPVAVSTSTSQAKAAQPSQPADRVSLDPQAAALEAAKKALAARQAAKEKQADPASRVPKRPTFKRPTAKRPAPTALPEAPPAQRPRTAAPGYSSTLGHAGSHLFNSDAPARDISPAWSPTQDQPYSPGAQGTAWSPSTAYQPPETPPGTPPYSPTHHQALPESRDQDQGYTGTQAEHQIPAHHHHQTSEADRTVFVGNVSDHISDAELAEYFCDVGDVLTVQIRGNDGAHYAFVEFAHPEHVENVLTLANQQPFMLEDVVLRVQPRHGKSGHQNAPLGHHGGGNYDEGEAELPAERAARIQAEVHAAAAAAVDELDPEMLRNAKPAPQPDRELMVYDDI